MNSFAVDFVLLVDDDPPTNYFHRIVLEDTKKVGRIHDCTSAEEALGWFQRAIDSNAALPDLVFLDINMPGMDGWSFLDAWRDLSWPGNKPIVVMLTTSVNPDDRIRGEGHPELAMFSTKPLSEAVLAKVVLTHLPHCIQ